MARIRTIKPEFFEDEGLAELPIEASYLFAGTWVHADDLGVITANPKLLKSKIFPLRENIRLEQVKTWLDQLVKARMLVPFTHCGEGYYIIRTFGTHQVINRPGKHTKFSKETIQEILSEHSLTTPGAITEDSLNTHGGLTEYSLTEEEKEVGKGREGSEEKKSATHNKEVLFEESIYYNKETYQAGVDLFFRDFSAHQGGKYANLNIMLLYEKLLTWSQSTGKKARNWLAMGVRFIQQSTDPDEFKQVTRSEVKDFVVKEKTMEELMKERGIE